MCDQTDETCQLLPIDDCNLYQFHPNGASLATYMCDTASGQIYHNYKLGTLKVLTVCKSPGKKEDISMFIAYKSTLQ